MKQKRSWPPAGVRRLDMRFLLVLTGFALVLNPGPAAAASEPAVLAVVNGDSVTAADLDELLIETHQQMTPERRSDFDFHRLLDKLINDRLILQQAEALGLREEPRLLEEPRENLEQAAIRSYVRDQFTPPDSAGDEAVRNYIETYYWKIQLRSISVEGKDEAERLREAVLSGAYMDSLARQHSQDRHAARGGLQELKPWANIPPIVRRHVEDLEIGQLSEPFSYRRRYSFFRVEDRQPVTDEEYETRAPGVRTYLTSEASTQALTDFVEAHVEQAGITEHHDVLADIEADSSDVLRDTFLNGSGRPALEIEGGHAVTEAELRRAISRTSMGAGDRSFAANFRAALGSKKQELALLAAADSAGYLEQPELQARYGRDVRDTLIEAYLHETIASRIRFNREEFRRYYEENPDQFRAPDEVLLGTLTIQEEAKAQEVHERLEQGGDFEFLRRLYAEQGRYAEETSKWVSVTAFNEDIRAEINRLPVGGTTPPFQTPQGWVLFKVKDRRRGEVKPMEEVEPQLREIFFQKKFNERLDEHMALLKERSEIRRFEDNIEAYFENGS
ncbi:MAG: hypothetical protein GF355_11980 [Candidatus Eisenbacteria bacterium]|nr:hypothetical protein [Candidatus Eisenbacteria bacterium]